MPCRWHELEGDAVLESSFLESLASDHIRGRKNYVLELNAVLTLEAVERLLLRDAGAAR